MCGARGDVYHRVWTEFVILIVDGYLPHACEYVECVLGFVVDLLHARVDLSEFVPTPCNQGELFACTAWAGGYGLMTYLAAENIEGWLNLDRTDRHFSPTFILNEGRQKLYGNVGYRVIEANLQELLKSPDASQASWC